MLEPQAHPLTEANPVAQRPVTPSPALWPYPGARWWTFDFHAHTPASTDTPHWQQAIGTDQEVTAERWLAQFMAAGIDCVAITDHNTGAWIDPSRLLTNGWNSRPRQAFGPWCCFPA